MLTVHIQTEPIALDSSAGLPWHEAEHCGAEVRFIGTVRQVEGPVSLSHLNLEHFPEVTESEIQRILTQARERWPIQGARVIHRVGRIALGEVIVLVETSAAHRHDAYDANRFIMDFLKTEAPFWKQECFVDGSARWVAAREGDAHAARSWLEITTPSNSPLSHFDARGQAHMVDVGGKPVTHRKAVAQGSIRMSAEAFAVVQGGNGPKGDVLGVARIAAIQGAKQTSALIPLCHPLPLTHISVEFLLDAERRAVTIEVLAETDGKTGVEMEALTGASVGLLTLYDMLKAVDKGMAIGDVRLLRKEGGRSGVWESAAPYER